MEWLTEGTESGSVLASPLWRDALPNSHVAIFLKPKAGGGTQLYSALHIYPLLFPLTVVLSFTLGDDVTDKHHFRDLHMENQLR